MSLKSFIGFIEKKTKQQRPSLIPTLERFVSDEVRRFARYPLLREKVNRREAVMNIAAAKARIAEFNHGKPFSKSEFVVHPSSLGGCLRRIWFDHFKAPRKVVVEMDALRSYFIFELGSSLHLSIQNLLERVGLLTQREVSVVSRFYKIMGHCDGVIRLHGKDYLLEIKSINSRGFTLLSAPRPEHLVQVHCYMKVMKLDLAIILYYDKDRASLKEFCVPFDEDFYTENCARRIATLEKSIKKKTPPEREGPAPDKFPCSFCPFTETCFHLGKLRSFQKSL